MGYVFDYNDARAYAQFMNRQGDSWAKAQEGRLMLNLLNPQRGESILDIGCGTGASTLPLLDRGLNLTGIDPSPYMLDIFSAKVGHKVDLYRGCAEDLPFGDNEFNHAFFFLSLEFVEDPLKAVSEACRVAKDRVFFGFVNRMAFKGGRGWREKFDQTGIFDHARIFSVWELKRVVREVAGPVPVSYRTVCHFPRASNRVLQSFEASGLVQRFPFGAFAGMVTTLLPRYRTRPLTLRYVPKKAGARIVAGSAPVGSAALGQKTAVKSGRIAGSSRAKHPPIETEPGTSICQGS